QTTPGTVALAPTGFWRGRGRAGRAAGPRSVAPRGGADPPGRHAVLPGPRRHERTPPRGLHPLRARRAVGGGDRGARRRRGGNRLGLAAPGADAIPGPPGPAGGGTMSGGPTRLR